MKIETSAGRFKLVAYTDGAPIQVSITTDDCSGIERIGADDLSDLIYAAMRMQDKIANVELKNGSDPHSVFRTLLDLRRYVK